MKFCTNCGADLKQTARFCMKCGKEIVDVQEGSIRTSLLSGISFRKMNITWTKRQTIFYSLISGLALILLICHLVLSSMASPEKKVRALEELLLEKDAEALYDMLMIEKDVQGTPEQLLRFLTTEDIHSSISSLIETAERAAKTKSDQLWGSKLFESGDLLSIKHRKLLFYNTIDIASLTVEMKVLLPAESTITVAEKDFSSETEQAVNIGTFIPGEYDISYDAHVTIVPLRGKGSLLVPSLGGEKQSVTLEDIVEGETVTLQSAFDGLLYINGKSTNHYVSEMSSLFPVSFNENLKLKVVAKDVNGSEMHSNELPLTSNELVFEFPTLTEKKSKKWSMDTLKEQADALFTQLQDDYQNILKSIDFIMP